MRESERDRNSKKAIERAGARVRAKETETDRETGHKKNTDSQTE